MSENYNYKVLVLDEDERTWPLYEDIMGGENVEIEIESSLEEVESQDYDTVVTDYIGEETHEVWEKWGDVLFYTANERDILDIPDEVEYIQKGLGFGELRDKIDERLRNYELVEQ